MNKKYSLRAKLLALAVVCIFILILSGYIGISVLLSDNSFFDAHYLVIHPVLSLSKEEKRLAIRVSWPLSIESKQIGTIHNPIASNFYGKNLSLSDKRQIVLASNYPKILDGMWMLETTRGKGVNPDDPTNHQSNCDKRGKTNEFGYDPQGRTCFDSFEQSVSVVDGWIDKHIAHMSLDQMLCYYATGKYLSSCSYSVNFHRLDSTVIF